MSRNKQEGRYCGKINGEHIREINKMHPKLLGWAWVEICCIEDEYINNVRPFLIMVDE